MVKCCSCLPGLLHQARMESLGACSGVRHTPCLYPTHPSNPHNPPFQSTLQQQTQGEWYLPLMPDQVAAVRAALDKNGDKLDEALLSNAFAWIRCVAACLPPCSALLAATRRLSIPLFVLCAPIAPSSLPC